MLMKSLQHNNLVFWWLILKTANVIYSCIWWCSKDYPLEHLLLSVFIETTNVLDQTAWFEMTFQYTVLSIYLYNIVSDNILQTGSCAAYYYVHNVLIPNSKYFIGFRNLVHYSYSVPYYNNCENSQVPLWFSWRLQWHDQFPLDHQALVPLVRIRTWTWMDHWCQKRSWRVFRFVGSIQQKISCCSVSVQ